MTEKKSTFYTPYEVPNFFLGPKIAPFLAKKFHHLLHFHNLAVSPPAALSETLKRVWKKIDTLNWSILNCTKASLDEC